MPLRSINPYSNRLIEEFEEFSTGYLDELLIESSNAFTNWKKTDFSYRESLMKNVSRILLQNCDQYAEYITKEMGKPISESRAEVQKCAWVCDYYADKSSAFLKDETIETDADISYITYEPLGTILGIMPWNFPFWQVFRFVVPALMAGNTVLLKHSSNVQICARNIASVFNDAGFPSSVLCNLVIGSEKVNRLIESDVVKAVSLTGSEYAGQRVAEAAGRNIKKSLLELGGSNAFVVLDDANVERAVEIGIKARMQNAGQSCIAAKRFIVHKDISDKFISLFKEEIGKLIVGDPTSELTNIGPLASIKQSEEVEKQVMLSKKMGARIVIGGTRDKSFYSPTLMVDVHPGMPVFDEEVFGPVAPVTIANDTSDAIKLANRSNFGLGVSLFTSDMEKAKELVKEFDDGAVFINALVKSDPRLPFGGTKKSGYGRELAIQGIKEFVNIKTVYIKKN